MGLSASDAATVGKLAAMVRKRMEGETTGHDWWHVYRVWKNSVYLAGRERGADLFVVQLAALLHDISDWKFNGGDTRKGARIAARMLKGLKVDAATADEVCRIVEGISFKGGFGVALKTKNGGIVQDADRIDALGAIGIARTFAYGGSKGRQLYDPGVKPRRYRSFDDFKRSHARSTTINHFYEKLLLLRGGMNTAAARKLAMGREAFMKEYLRRFYREWEGLE